MVELLAKAKNDEAVYTTYLDALQKEYDFWQLRDNETAIANHHTVKLEGDEILNRYFDESTTPRPESYAEVFHLSQSTNQTPVQLCANIRAGAESGWDFSSRWFADFQTIETIETTNIVPVDLNCLVLKLENVLAKGYKLVGEIGKANALKTNASKRWKAILKYCWNEGLGFFTDYNWANKSIINFVSAGGLIPLFIADAEDGFIKSKINSIAQTVKDKLLKGGGLVTTPIASGQQWDAPNGWAPLQWVAVKGLDNFGEKELAKNMAQRWVSLNEKVYANTGKMMEKYDVVDLGKLAGGGEYESQDGFGWSNGVYLALKKFLKEIENRSTKSPTS
jgi:alpha,alpha-trehalase